MTFLSLSLFAVLAFQFSLFYLFLFIGVTIALFIAMPLFQIIYSLLVKQNNTNNKKRNMEKYNNLKKTTTRDSALSPIKHVMLSSLFLFPLPLPSTSCSSLSFLHFPSTFPKHFIARFLNSPNNTRLSLSIIFKSTYKVLYLTSRLGIAFKD